MEVAPAEPSANRIVVYERPGFEGLQREFTCDVPDLHELDFGDCISSLRVVGQPWVAYTGPKYEGDAFPFEEGEYAEVEPRGSFSSLRLVHHDLDEPQITLYEDAGFAGRSKVVTEETNLAYGYFDDRVSSHEVQRGVWLLYQDPGRGGQRYIAWPGERLADYRPGLRLQDRLSHLRPLRPGRPRITARLLWDQKRVEEEREVLLDEMVAVNETETEQALSSGSSREYSTVTAQSFHFSAATRLRAGLAFTLALEAAAEFRVEKGRSESRTLRERAEVLLPAKVPPRTRLAVQVVRREAAVVVPVELTLLQNERVRTERGEYRCRSAASLCARYTMTPIADPAPDRRGPAAPAPAPDDAPAPAPAQP
ncbi:epidermal differentiation-specific protein-like [Alligator mississippiensis]|uniref:Epidermal differentiation-specific protein-like n=1 Tax=Alligator mississippiensis TaxID=8496 RepID=A0A151NG11_ALLMI|nr:epidermal differentiation-specific protein-like [Alligator mississippiensis]